MTTTAPHDITPPPGAAVVDDWEPGPPPYRIILGIERNIDDYTGGRGVQTWTSVAQFADGTIDRVGEIDLPMVHVDVSGDGLTAGQARQLARVLIAAADELGEWTR